MTESTETQSSKAADANVGTEPAGQSGAFKNAVAAVLGSIWTVVSKALRWLFATIYRVVRQVCEHLYTWFLGLEPAGKVLLIIAIVLLLFILYLSIKLEFWYIFYGNIGRGL